MFFFFIFIKEEDAFLELKTKSCGNDWLRKLSHIVDSYLFIFANAHQLSKSQVKD